MPPALRILPPLVLCALAAELDQATGLLLRTGLDLPSFPLQAARLVEFRAALVHALVWVIMGGLLLGVLAWRRSRRGGGAFGAALALEAPLLDVLYLKPVLSALALASLTLRPTFPYAFTLPVALTQDLHPAVDAAVLAALLARRAPLVWAIPAPRATGLFFMVFVAYAFLSPTEARVWGGHPGNEPKYLRMAAALASRMSLNVEEVSALDPSAPLESLPMRPLGAAIEQAVGTLIHESSLMLRAIGRGAEALKETTIQSRRVAHETVDGKDGGIYHVLAPGPSFLLAPFLRLDRALNLLRGTPGRLDLTLLAWNALGAALVSVLFLFLRDATTRPGLSALLAGVFALTPPFLFFFFQFYPETLGALVLAGALRTLVLRRAWTSRTCSGLGLLLAVLPWLHQKYLPVWGVLVLLAFVKAVDELVPIRGLLFLLAPQAVSLYFVLLYNFAITASVRPDALFLAWGREGVTSARIGEGLLGLLFDARYGLVPYAPVYLLAVGGFSGKGARSLLWGLPAVLTYYLTVASATNWSGSISNLGRFLLPVSPFLVVLVGLALGPVLSKRGGLALVLALFGWTGLVAQILWADPAAANDCALLLRKSTFADGNVYLPNLFFRSWNYDGPGHLSRILAWLLGAGLLALWFHRVARGRGGSSPNRALAGLCAAILTAALALERWPSPLKAPRFWNGFRIRRDATAFVSGSIVLSRAGARARSGDVFILVSSGAPLPSLTLLASGEGLLRLPGRSPLFLPRSGAEVTLPLEPLGTFTGRGGAKETLSRQRFRVESPGEVALLLGAPGEAAFTATGRPRRE